MDSKEKPRFATEEEIRNSARATLEKLQFSGSCTLDFKDNPWEARYYLISRWGENLYEFCPTELPLMPEFLAEDVKRGSLDMMVEVILWLC